MPLIQRLTRVCLLGLLATGLLSACSVGDDDPESTQTPIIITATPTPPAADEAEPTSTPATTATLAALATPAATTEPTSTAEPSPTPRPTQPSQPTATTPPRTAPTPTATLPSTDGGSSGGLEIPSDLLAILPAVEDAPAGMIVVDEGAADIALVASDFEDEAARQQQLQDWGFQAAVFRELELPEDQIVDQASQPIGLITRVVLLGSPEAAQAEMHSFVDEIVLADPEVSATEVAIDPIGDAHRAVTATVDDGEGGSFNVAYLGVAAGPLSMQFIAGSGAQYDPLPDTIAAAQTTLGYLGYVAVPARGEVLLETNFSNWPVSELESGQLYMGEDGFYHVLVDQGGGSFVSAYSTDHEPYTDVAVSVALHMQSGDPTSQGCVMTRVDQLEQLYDYALCVDGNGNVEALYEQFDADGNYTFEPLLPEGITVAPPGPEGTPWTTLTIISRGEEFWFLIDGQLLGTATHTGPPGGSVGVLVNHYAESPTAPAEFAFTNLVVHALE